VQQETMKMYSTYGINPMAAASDAAADADPVALWSLFNWR